MFYCFLSAIYFMLEWLKVLHWKRSNTGRQKLFSISFFFQYFDVLPAIDFTLVWHNRDSRQGPPLAPAQPYLFSKQRISHFEKYISHLKQIHFKFLTYRFCNLKKENLEFLTNTIEIAAKVQVSEVSISLLWKIHFKF